MSFPKKVQIEALAACGRRCCICHKFCGTKIALHHIKQKADGGNDSFDNCIPLCLDCHEDMGKADPRHVTGKHYSEMELKLHRDNWYKKVQNPIEGVEIATEDEIKNLFRNNAIVSDGKITSPIDDFPINSNIAKIEVPNRGGGLTVIIDDERYINEKAIEELSNDIEKKLREI